MTIFVAHEQNDQSTIRSQKIVLQLQYENPTHCFIPAAIAFEHLYNGDFSAEDAYNIELDLLMNCDQMLIVSDVSPIMQRQIDFARMVGMEVVDLADKYRQI